MEVHYSTPTPDLSTESLYLLRFELAHTITLDRNEIRAWDLYYSTVLLGAVVCTHAKVSKFSTLECKRTHGKIPYQKPQLKFMMHGIIIAQCMVPTLRDVI